MFSYFTSDPDSDIRYPIRKYFEWNIIHKMATGELAKVKDYYRHREYSYPNNNMLIRLLKLLVRDPEMDIFEYMQYVDTDATYLPKQFGIASTISPGGVHENVLFRAGSDEAFLAIDQAPDPIEMESLWEDYESIKVIHTDLTDTDYPVLFDYIKTTKGLTVYTIDLRAIAMQYYYWARTRMNTELAVNINVFFPMVVIPNITNSLMDMCIWNRFKMIASGRPLLSKSHKHPMALIDYTEGIDDVLSKLVHHISKSSAYVSELLRSVPMLSAGDGYELLQIPQSLYTRQDKWVLWIARMDDIMLIHKLSGKKGERLNRQLYNQLPVDVRAMRNREGKLEDTLNEQGANKLEEFMSYVDKNIGKR